jgi:hypothetical protein
MTTMKFAIFLLAFLLCACAQPETETFQTVVRGDPTPSSWSEVAAEPAPFIQVTRVTKRIVEFEVQNNSPIPFYFIGKRNGDPFAALEVGAENAWRLSHYTISSFGAQLYAIEPGESFEGSVANYNEGPVRIVMSFTAENKWNSPYWVSVSSDFHEDWKEE